MRDAEFRSLDSVAESINDKFEELHDAGAFAEILKQIQEASQTLPGTHSVTFDVRMEVYDKHRQKSLSLLTTGFAASKGQDPYRHYGDSTPQKYLVEGEMCMVPDNYCPHCWGDWDFKFKHGTCPECAYELGRKVKYLLDNDVCPYCQEGKVTVEKPRCDQCGFEVDGKKVVWG